jgi:teichuronic acid biosynthesis glycosyltransferase TuaG
MPLVSVVIPTYNAANFIVDTISSVLNQSHSDLEVIVVDDCSTDDTASIVRNICDEDFRLTLIELEKNMGGPAGPRNVGVANASGEWVCFVDADDLWHFTKISRQLSVLNSLGASFCCTNIAVFTDKSDFVDLGRVPSTDNYNKYTFRQLCSKNRICNSSVMVSIDLLKDTPFFESPSYHAVEDLQCWLQILEAIDECIIIDEPLVGYRISANQISKNKLKMAKKFLMVISRYRLASGESLGWKVYFYFIMYCGFSLWSFVKRSLELKKIFK